MDVIATRFLISTRPMRIGLNSLWYIVCSSEAAPLARADKGGLSVGYGLTTMRTKLSAQWPLRSSGLRDAVRLKGQSLYRDRVVCALISINSDGHKPAFPLHSGGTAAASRYGSETQPKLPGTIVLVIVFFVAFALYDFINWKISVGALAIPLIRSGT